MRAERREGTPLCQVHGGRGACVEASVAAPHPQHLQRPPPITECTPQRSTQRPADRTRCAARAERTYLPDAVQLLEGLGDGADHIVEARAVCPQGISHHRQPQQSTHARTQKRTRCEGGEREGKYAEGEGAGCGRRFAWRTTILRRYTRRPSSLCWGRNAAPCVGRHGCTR
jgi:hypothetical protein